MARHSATALDAGNARLHDLNVAWLFRNRGANQRIAVVNTFQFPRSVRKRFALHHPQLAGDDLTLVEAAARTRPRGSGTPSIWPGRTKDAALAGPRCYSGWTASWGSMAPATWPTAVATANATRRQAPSACNTSPALVSKPSPGCPTRRRLIPISRLIPIN